MKRIRQLPENLINQIAAGEAIERPASVVKELSENSVDAGATRIEIEISNGCRDIRVADNGHGIHRDDIIPAFSRHATSKIEKQDDLWSLFTLGFRGEALSSIISVAQVTCITRTADSETGIKAECENSQVKFSDIGCAVGTTMEVKDLFYNVPARLKFLKKTHTELAAISEVVQNIALSNPEIAFNLIHNKNSILRTTGSNDLAIVISEVYSKEIISRLCGVSREDEQFQLKISGFVSSPDCTRSNKKAIYTFINGRTIKCPVLSKAIDTAYSDLIPSGRHPYAILSLSMPPKDLDVNVHPSKKEVKYTKPNLIFNFVYSAVKEALSADKALEKAVAPSCEQPKILEFPKFAAFSPETGEVEEIETNDVREVTYKQPVQSKLAVETAEKPKIIGQFDNTYILIESKEGIQIIDQHIAHERYLYDKLKKENIPASQLLLDSRPMEAEPEQLSLLEENADILAKYGYKLNFMEKGVVLRQVPRIVAEKDPQKVLNDLLKAVESSPDTIEDEILTRTACLSAIKAGERLSVWQMEELITDWQGTDYPMTCPHGRKIVHTLAKREIAGFFGR